MPTYNCSFIDKLLSILPESEEAQELSKEIEEKLK